jgi:8-oxo-dGTP pyrophosphatase MutT (NUDIX family)
LKLPVPDATAVVCAAVRELYEEAGVLLAGIDETSVVDDASKPDWERDRLALENRELSMSQFLSDRQLVIRTDLLAAWRAWLTPEFEPRRYLSYFFVAHLPSGQDGRTASGESDGSMWMEVREALAGAGSLHTMLPPQICTCAEFLPFDSADELFQAARGLRRTRVLPTIEHDGDGVRLGLPAELLDYVDAATAELVP